MPRSLRLELQNCDTLILLLLLTYKLQDYDKQYFPPQLLFDYPQVHRENL